MDILEDLLEGLFGNRKQMGWRGEHHDPSDHRGQTNYPYDKPPVTCPNCRAENDPASGFCSACGAGLRLNKPRQEFIRCSHCGSQNDPDKASCLSCGAPLSRVAPGACPSCAAAIPSGARFCPRCGQAVPSN